MREEQTANKKKFPNICFETYCNRPVWAETTAEPRQQMSGSVRPIKMYNNFFWGYEVSKYAPDCTKEIAIIDDFINGLKLGTALMEDIKKVLAAINK